MEYKRISRFCNVRYIDSFIPRYFGRYSDFRISYEGIDPID